jgi:hypothetical protein
MRKLPVILSTPLLAAALATGCASSSPPPSAEPAQKKAAMQTPSYLTEAARLKIRASMGIHRENMAGLLSSLLVLDKDSVNHFAEAISAQPRLTQDMSAPKDERIPARVIELQEELHTRADALVTLVNSKEKLKSAELADGFANLAKVCVTCHASYLYPEE